MNARFFKDKLFGVHAQNFEAQALSLFRWQAQHNPVYSKYLHFLGVQPSQVSKLEEIPYLPISFFKNHKVLSREISTKEPSDYFESSGTTGQQTSRHYVEDMAFYLQVCRRGFESVYGSLHEYHVFALLPSYLERQHASLVAMAEHFIKISASSLSGFYLKNYEDLLEQIGLAKQSGRKVLLLGVTFALLELAERGETNLEGVVVMETGGMKGRRKEMIRAELHELLCRGLNVQQIHSEYGMTELMSQAYSEGEGKFYPPPWMRIILRDINDPFHFDNNLRYGGINVIDLANVHSCAFIETQDLGKYHQQNGSFEVLGRFDNTDTRGCNLMVAG
ncbi:MAG: acyl transferase [Cyclobacteriaceae bacterium]